MVVQRPATCQACSRMLPWITCKGCGAKRSYCTDCNYLDLLFPKKYCPTCDARQCRACGYSLTGWRCKCRNYGWYIYRGLYPNPFGPPAPELEEPTVDRRQGQRRFGLLLLERDGPTCALCKELFVKGDSIHIDHYLPRSLGGSDDLPNLQLAHAICNLRKHNTPP